MPTFKRIAFCGGGGAAVSEAGVVIGLGKLQKWEPDEIVGVSAGAALAAIAALYPPDKLKPIVMNMDFSSFVNDGWGPTCWWRWVTRGGLHSHALIEYWLKDLIVGALGKGHENITYAEWHAMVLKEGPPYQDLITFSTNLDLEPSMPEEFSYRNSQYAHVEVWRGICASMAFEDMFSPVPIRGEDGVTYRFVDGGTQRNYPIDYFIGDKSDVLGVWIDTEQNIKHLRDGVPLPKTPYHGGIEMNERALEAALYAQPLAAIQGYRLQTVFVNDLGMTALNFKAMTPSMKEHLLASGDEAVRQKLEADEIFTVGAPSETYVHQQEYDKEKTKSSKGDARNKHLNSSPSMAEKTAPGEVASLGK